MPLVLMLAHGSSGRARERIVLAMSGGVVYTPDGEPVDLQVMMRLYPCPE